MLVSSLKAMARKEAAARGVIDAGLPEEFAEFLRTGGRPAAS